MTRTKQEPCPKCGQLVESERGGTAAISRDIALLDRLYRFICDNPTCRHAWTSPA